jgi:hypothetical protein
MMNGDTELILDVEARERSRNMNAQDSGRRRSARTPTPQDRHIVRDGSDIDRREREEDISSSDITSHGLELPTKCV